MIPLIAIKNDFKRFLLKIPLKRLMKYTYNAYTYISKNIKMRNIMNLNEQTRERE